MFELLFEHFPGSFSESRLDGVEDVSIQKHGPHVSNRLREGNPIACLFLVSPEHPRHVGLLNRERMIDSALNVPGKDASRARSISRHEHVVGFRFLGEDERRVIRVEGHVRAEESAVDLVVGT